MKKQQSYEEKAVCQEGLFPVNGEQVKKLLHRSIGAIVFFDNNMCKYSGTGVLISRNMVLTAAHNVFDRIEGYDYHDFKVYFGADGVAKDYYEVEGVRCMEEFKTSEKDFTPFDFAIIKLKKQVEYTEFLQISLVCPPCLLEKQRIEFVQVYGFPPNYQGNYQPLDKYQKQIKLRQFGRSQKNRILKIHPQQYKMCYRISTLKGQSGSPVTIDNKIIAVHVRCGKEGEQFNIGRMVDLPLFTQLEDWCRQLNGHPFQICSKDLCAHLRPTVEVYLKEKQERKFKKTTIQLELRSKQIKQINVSEYINLTKLNLYNNQLSAIDVIKNTNLADLRVSNNQLSAIDVSKNTNLTVLQLHKNKISAIDVTKNTNLTHLSLYNNQLSAIDVSKNTNLTYLSLYNNQLSAIDVIKNTNLADLRVSNNQLSAIDVTKNTNLTVLHLFYNQLSAIDVTKNTNLTWLYLYNNQLSAIDVTKNTNLTELRLYNNKLSAIDVTKNTNLTQLSLYNNQLSAIDVTKNTKLDCLRLQNNRLETVSLSFVASKPIEKYLGSYENGFLYFDFSNQFSAVCKIQILYNSADKSKCSELKEGWAKKYGDKGGNEHGCKYAFSAVESYKK